MKTIYPNETVKLKRGGRSSDKMTTTEFNSLIHEKWEKLKKIDDEAEDYYECESLEWLFLLNEHFPTFAKDLKYHFDFENVVEQEGGIKLTVGGTPYKEFICGGDWEKGLLVYVYPGNGKLRAYIPTKGNLVRTDLRCVFGNELEDPETRLDYLRKWSSEEIQDKEAIKFELNKDWCLEDFETRLGER